MNEQTGYIGFGNETLNTLPDIHKGDKITCPHCGKRHTVEPFKDDKGNETTTLGYKCGEGLYLAGVDGKCVVGIKPDCSGKV